MSKTETLLAEVKAAQRKAAEMWGFSGGKVLYHRAQDRSEVQESLEGFAIAARYDIPRLVAMLEEAHEALLLYECGCKRSSSCLEEQCGFAAQLALAELDRIAGSGNVSEPTLIKSADRDGA